MPFNTAPDSGWHADSHCLCGLSYFIFDNVSIRNVERNFYIFRDVTITGTLMVQPRSDVHVGRYFLLIVLLLCD